MFGGFRKIIREVSGAILPVTAAVVILQFALVRMPAATFLKFLAGALLVMVGLALFLQGVKFGLLPVGEAIGSKLPGRGSAAILLVAVFLVSFAVTVAEPDVRVLAHHVDTVSDGQISKSVLVLAVALGVGVFMVFAMLRTVLRIPVAYVLFAGYMVVFALAFFAPSKYVPISLDAGGVTTGPMTVPFILALGIGVSSVLGGRSSFAESFGLIGIASIGPVISVMVLGMVFG